MSTDARRERIFRLIAVGVTLLMTLVVAEVVAGIIYKRSKLENGKRIVDAALRPRGTPAGSDGTILPHPYMLFQNAPNLEAFGWKQHNSRGYRGPEIDAPKRRLRVLVLGGSTAHAFPYVKDPSKIWPALLEKKLGADRVEVVNAGVPYATSAEVLAGYLYRNRYLEADVVLVDAGGNDMLAMLFPGYDPEYTHFRSVGRTPYIGGLERLLLRSRMLRILFASNWNGAPTVYTSQPYGIEELDRAETLERARTGPTEGLRRNLDLLVSLLQRDGAAPVLVGYLQAREPNLTRNRPDLRGNEQAMLAATERTRAVMRGVAEQHGVPFIDPPIARFKDEWFQDNCHLTEEGEATKAEIVYGVVAPLVEARLKARAAH